MTDLPECPSCHLAEAWRGDASGVCVKCGWSEAQAPKASVFRLDMTNVTKACVACSGLVVTSHTRIPVCAKCRMKGLVGQDELKQAHVVGFKAGVEAVARWLEHPDEKATQEIIDAVMKETEGSDG